MINDTNLLKYEINSAVKQLNRRPYCAYSVYLFIIMRWRWIR